VIDLGTVHLTRNRGRFVLSVPPPPGFSVRDRLKGTMITADSPGGLVRYRGSRFTGVAQLGQGPQPWVYKFLVEYQSQRLTRSCGCGTSTRW